MNYTKLNKLEHHPLLEYVFSFLNFISISNKTLLEIFNDFFLEKNKFKINNEKNL